MGGLEPALTLLANSFDEVARRHPRWVTWRRQWSHIVSCRANTELEAGEVPALLIASGDGHGAPVDPVHYRAEFVARSGRRLRCKELIDAVLQRSEEAFPATLGL
jgi:hypothetical protein